MAESVSIVAGKREVHGSRAARRIRQQGLVPAVVYGHKEATVSVTVPADEVEHAVRHGVHIVDLDADGKVEKALIREVQWDHLGKHLLHVDFSRVSADERVVVTVPLEIRGTALGVAAGGVLDQTLHTLAVECPVVRVPDSIRVNVSELQLGHSIHVKNLVLPPDVKAVAEPDTVVVHVAQKHVAEEVPLVPAAEAAEPEVITRPKGAEEEGE